MTRFFVVLSFIVISNFSYAGLTCNQLLDSRRIDSNELSLDISSAFSRPTQKVAVVELSYGQRVYIRKTGIPYFIELMIARADDDQIIEILNSAEISGDLDSWINIVSIIYRFGKISQNEFNLLQPEVKERDWSALEAAFHYLGAIYNPENEWLELLDWVNSKSLTRHFKKHVIEAREFEASSEEDYLELAQKFITSNNPHSPLIKTAPGEYMRFDYWTFEFAVIRNNKIITYYILNEEYRTEDKHDSYLANELLKRSWLQSRAAQ